MPNTGFSATPDIFLHLAPGHAVSLFRRLLWAEAGRVGIGRNLVDVPDCINVGDGGIDAFINNANPSSEDLIPRGSSVFQIKSADLTPSACREELHEAGNLSRRLKPELSVRLDEGATYVLVLMADITNVMFQNRCEALRSELDEHGYANTPVRIYTANQLAAFASRHPAFVASVRPWLSTCFPHERWGTFRDVQVPGTFVADSDRENLVDSITQTMRERTTCPVIRLTGLPGVGKTRSAYEALLPDDLSNQVLYIHASELAGSGLVNLLSIDQETSAILVVDECDLEQHRQLTNALSTQGPRLGLITMSYEVGNIPMPTLPLHACPLEVETIENILRQEYPNLPSLTMHRLAEFSGGYPRIADLLAENFVTEGAATPYISVSDDDLMGRLIRGRLPIGSEQYLITKAVLTSLSLFQRIGIDGMGEEEGKWLADWFEIPWQQFRQVVAEQKERGIIQGEHYVYVTPFMLRVHLLKEWWTAQGFRDEDSLSRFLSAMPSTVREDLFRRFIDHMPYVAGAERGLQLVRQMLGSDGIFSDYGVLDSDLGGRLFLALTEADAEVALRTLQRLLGGKSREELLNFQRGRRHTVEALTRMAVWQDLFQPASRLMLALAEAETESWANNASGEFANLFNTGIGELAPTEAPFTERFPVLREAMLSDSPIRRKLALRACRSALNAFPSHKVLGPEYQGLRKEPNFWRPATYGELFDAYRDTWGLVRDSLRTLDDDEKREAIDVLLRSARGLTRYVQLTDMIVETFQSIDDDQHVDRRDIINRIVQTLHYDGGNLQPEIAAKWRELYNSLSGDDFSSRLERFVAMNLLEDRHSFDGEAVDKAQSEIERLAFEAMEEPELLVAEVSWLVTKRAEAGHRFGYELGKLDVDRLALQDILTAQANAGQDESLDFFGGYLRAVCEREPATWEELMDGVARNPLRANWIVSLTWHSGSLSKRASNRILNLIRRGLIPPETLGVFRFGGLVCSLESEDFDCWVSILLENDELRSTSTALDLLVMYFEGRETPKEPALSVISHPSWFRQTTDFQRLSHYTYWWSDVAEAMCNRFHETTLHIANLMLRHLGDSGTIVQGFEDSPLKVLDTAMRQQPEKVWELASSMLGPPIDARAFHIREWLKGSEDFGSGGSHILEVVPRELVWRWVDEEPEFRPIYLAGFVPKLMNGPSIGSSLARDLLVRYGDNEKVRTELGANFSSEGWMGAESQHLSDKRSWLLDIRNNETDPNVLLWIDEYIGYLERRIEAASQEEEREGWL